MLEIVCVAFANIKLVFRTGQHSGASSSTAGGGDEHSLADLNKAVSPGVQLNLTPNESSNGTPPPSQPQSVQFSSPSAHYLAAYTSSQSAGSSPCINQQVNPM